MFRRPSLFRKALFTTLLLAVTACSAGDWYTATGVPSTGSQGSSAAMRGEFNLINTAMDKLPTITGNGSKAVFVNSGATDLEAVTAATARANLGVVLGTDVQAWDNDLDDLAALIPTDSNIIVGNGTDWIAESGATARASLGLGSIATQSASSVSITGGSVTGITDITVVDGGTGVSTLTNGGVLLGSGTGTVTAMPVLADGEIIVGDGTTDPVAESGATARTSLGAAASGANSDITSLTGLTTNIGVSQGGTGLGTLTDGGVLLGSGTTDVTVMAVLADGEIIVGDGTTDPVAESGATARTSLGAAASGANSDISSISGLTGTGTLSNYQEGIFTPTLQDSSSSDAEGQTYTSQVGEYTRIGDSVFISILLSVNSTGTLSTGNPLKITGLPFTPNAINYSALAATFGLSLNVTAGDMISGVISPSIDYITLHIWDVSTGSRVMTVGEFSAGGTIVLTGHYRL